MTTDADRFHAAIERFDAANREDPNAALVDGRPEPEALLYGRRMSAWLDRLEPGASEALRLAVRCQHLRRWTRPRDAYPMTRAGYHQWRTALGRFHAEEAGRILAEVGYGPATVARVGALVRKEGIKSDAEAQALEDVACLVFLENYFADFARRHEPDKVVGIVRRTWGKMSGRGHAAALGLPLPPDARAIIERALSE